MVQRCTMSGHRPESLTKIHTSLPGDLPLFPAVVVGVVVLRLVQADVVKVTAVLCDGALELLPDGDDQNLRRSALSLHEGHIDVQVPVIQWLLDMLLDDVFQVLQIHAVARVLGRNPFHSHVQLIVVAMPIGVGAFAEHFEVFGLVPFVVPQLVGGIESGAAGDVDVLHG